MSAGLPARPNLTQIKRQGKKLLLGVRSEERAALSRVQKSLPAQRRDALSRNGTFGLRDALLVIAREYGFSSWAKLKADVSARRRTNAGGRRRAEQVSKRETAMKRINANLYRFDSKPRGKSKTVSYSYLIVRKRGNLLICNQNCLVTDHLNEIEALGGIHIQLLVSYVDAKKGDYHETLHTRFGCKLCYHQDERKMARTKTKCPEVTFGDNGLLRLGPDFEAHHFPNRCQNGNSLFRWRCRGKHYLFTDHVLARTDGKWGLEFHPELWPEKRSLFAGLTKLEVDGLLPGNSTILGEEVCHLTDRTRKSFRAAIRSKLQPREGGLKKGSRPRKLRLVTNWMSAELWEAIESTGLYEIDKMKVHGNCALPLFFTYLAGADVMHFQGFQRKFRSGHPYLDSLREHVEKGGGLLLTDNVAGGDDRQIVSCHPFPEIAVREKGRQIGEGVPELVVGGKHPITGKIKGKTHFSASVIEHKGHRHVSYEGRTFEPGPQGQVLVRNASGDPVVVAGEVGKGRVVMSGFYYSTDSLIEGSEREIYLGAARWVARES